jgi:putative DNA primase/helicase
MSGLGGLDAHPGQRLGAGGIRANEVAPRAVDWLWWPYLPLGKISLVAGQMGQAKSLLTAWLAAYATPNGGVVMLSAEDDPADTIRPRLEAAGADLSRVEIAADVSLNADRLHAICEDLGDVRLITVDPVQAFLPASVNAWKGQDVRLALEPVRQLAADRELAVVLIQHLNRRVDGDPLARIADSQGVPQLARSVMIWGPDPSDPEGDHGAGKALTRVKGNLARGSSASATFTIVEKAVTGDIRAPALVRGGDAQITADDVIADHETRSARDEAVEWLRDLLCDGPIAAKDAQRQARDIGISDRTLKRAKMSAGVVSEPSRDENGISGWSWSLPESSTYNSGPLGTVGTLGPLDE